MNCSATLSTDFMLILDSLYSNLDNTRSLTFERYNYCRSLGHDILALTELWRNQHRNVFQSRNKQFITSEQILIKEGPRAGQPRFPDDKAAGVAITLSARMAKKVMSFGSQGERVCWVHLRGPTCMQSLRHSSVFATQRKGLSVTGRHSGRCAEGNCAGPRS